MKKANLYVSSAASALLSGFGMPANASYVWCWTAPLQPDNRKMFYTEVFEAPPNSNVGPAFGRYVQENYPQDGTGSGECKYYNSQIEASRYLRQYRDNSANFDKLQVIDVNWSP